MSTALILTTLKGLLDFQVGAHRTGTRWLQNDDLFTLLTFFTGVIICRLSNYYADLKQTRRSTR